MEHVLHTTLPEKEDDAVQARCRPASQPFRTQQHFPWAQPSFLMHQAINNELSHLTDGTYQEAPMDDLESIISPQVGELDPTIRSLMQQPMQPMFGSRSMPQPSRSMSDSSTNHSTCLNPGANADLKIQLFEEILPIASGDFRTMMLSPSLQQPAFRPSVIPLWRWPPDPIPFLSSKISLLSC